MEIELIPNTNLYEKHCKKFKIVRKDSGETHYYITLINNSGRCPNCGKYSTLAKDLIDKTIRHNEKQIIHYKARRLKCECNKTFYEDNPFIKQETNISDYLVIKILDELKRYNHTFLEVSQRYGVSVTKVIELFDIHVQLKRKALREVISIDEFYFSRHSRNKYAFMILGLNGEIIDIVESRKKTTLLDYFKYIPQLERNRVKYVTMDMNEVYKDVIKRRLKNAVICIDSFHVMKMMNDELDRVRKKIMHRYENSITHKDEYYLLKHKNYLLFKDELKSEYEYSKYYRCLMNEEDFLNRLLKIDSELTKVYQEVRRYYYFNHYWSDCTYKEAKEYLISYINECFLSNIKSLTAIGSTLDNWKEEILNSFIPYTKNNGEIIRLSNGKIEGKNSYLKKMIYLANGYSNFDRFRNRAMYCENYYDTYSLDKLPNTIKRKFPKKKRSI